MTEQRSLAKSLNFKIFVKSTFAKMENIKKFVNPNLREITIDWIGSQCGNYGNSISRICGRNFVKVTVLPKKLLNK